MNHDGAAPFAANEKKMRRRIEGRQKSPRNCTVSEALSQSRQKASSIALISSRGKAIIGPYQRELSLERKKSSTANRRRGPSPMLKKRRRHTRPPLAFSPTLTEFIDAVARSLLSLAMNIERERNEKKRAEKRRTRRIEKEKVTSRCCDVLFVFLIYTTSLLFLFALSNLVAPSPSRPPRQQTAHPFRPHRLAQPAHLSKPRSGPRSREG